MLNFVAFISFCFLCVVAGFFIGCAWLFLPVFSQVGCGILIVPALLVLPILLLDWLEYLRTK